MISFSVSVSVSPPAILLNEERFSKHSFFYSFTVNAGLLCYPWSHPLFFTEYHSNIFPLNYITLWNQIHLETLKLSKQGHVNHASTFYKLSLHM